MNQNYPQQPYGQQPQPWGPPPQPKKRSVGKFVGLGCLGIVGLFVLIGIIAGIAGSGGSGKSHSSSSVTPATTSASASTGKSSKPGKTAPTATASSKPKAKTVTFKVWGTAPAGALGGLDITYGSDTDTRKGTFKHGTFEATLPLNKDAMFYDVSAQLQGSGDINCSVTVDGHTKKGHASGGYNICSAQLSSGLFGDWS